MTGQLSVFFIVYVFDIQQYQISALHQAFELSEKSLCTSERLGGGIENCVYFPAMRLLKEIRQKVNLQEGLPAADSNAARITPVASVTFGLVQEFTDGHLPYGSGICHFCGQLIRPSRLCIPARDFSRCPCHFPCIRIMAVHASHPASLEKDQETYPRSIHGTERLGGVDPSHRVPWLPLVLICAGLCVVKHFYSSDLIRIADVRCGNTTHFLGGAFSR